MECQGEGLFLGLLKAHHPPEDVYTWAWEVSLPMSLITTEQREEVGFISRQVAPGPLKPSALCEISRETEWGKGGQISKQNLKGYEGSGPLSPPGSLQPTSLPHLNPPQVSGGAESFLFSLPCRAAHWLLWRLCFAVSMETISC